MKYLKKFNESNNDEQLIKDLIIDKEINITPDKQHSDMPFKGSVTFIPEDCSIVDNKYLFVYVPYENIKGGVTNTYKGRISDDKALCIAMTSWLAFNELKDYLGKYDILVYTIPVEDAVNEFF